MGEKENHHYIPQGYLRGFTIPKEHSLVWEYDKVTGEVSRDPRSIRQICCKHLYYAQYSHEGKLDKKLEDGLQLVENRVPKILRNIHPTRTGERFSLSPTDHGTLSYFVALTLTRTPSFRDGMEDWWKQAIKSALEQHVEHANKTNELPAVIKDLYESGRLFDHLDVTTKPHSSLRPMLQMAEIGGRSLLSKLWSFALPASDMFFVTSDNPVFFQLSEGLRHTSPASIGPFHPFSEVTIPLRKDLALICRPLLRHSAPKARLLQFRTVQLSSGDTKNINKRTAIAARRYVYAPAKLPQLARIVGKLKGTEQRIRS